VALEDSGDFFIATFIACFGVTLNNYDYLCMLKEIENNDDD